MKLLTLNTWQKKGPWRKRWELIFSGIKKMKPDIIAFQEIFDPQWAKEIRRKTGYRDSAFGDREAGLMFLSNLKIHDSVCLAYRAKSPSEECRRFALSVSVKKNDQPLTLFNTHLSWRPEEGAVREKQVRELLRIVGRETPGMTVLAMGDFNAGEETYEVKRMTGEGRFRDLYRAAHPAGRDLTWDNQNLFAAGASVYLPDRRIDYIFGRSSGTEQFKSLKVETVFREADAAGNYASDHFGVLAEWQEGKK
ncbi:MAG: hypothetical protein A2Z83_07275 [Omnitrophica bacterium GWA2_52_8]|nr:MAG: hypothetical protein A2Z83_07275 [Omnitrophica bacterium GWA2_52_8]